MRCTVLGCGDAFGTGGRHTTSFHLVSGERTLLLDCGASTLVAMGQQGPRTRDVDGLVLTHLHGDHFGGLPFLLLHEAFETGRTRPLPIAAPPGFAERLPRAVEALFGQCPDWPFDIPIHELTPGAATEIAGFTVTPTPVDHGSHPTYAVRVNDGERVLAYGADTAWTEALLEVAANADVFIAECFAWESAPPGHTDWQTLRSRLPELTAGRVVLTHMSSGMLARLNRVTEAMPAYDGMVLEL